MFRAGILNQQTLASPNQWVLNPIADSYVRSGTYGNDNYGSSTELLTKGNPSSPVTSYDREAYLKFDLSSVQGTPLSAILRVYVFYTNTDPSGFNVYGVTDDSWTELGITWNNAPGSGGLALDSVAVPVDAFGWYELDVTQFVRADADGTLSLHLQNNVVGALTNLSMYSREGTYPPQLIVETDGHPVTDNLILAIDGTIQESYPGSGTTVNDLSPSGRIGTLANGVSFDGAFVFDGLDDQINFGSVPSGNILTLATAAGATGFTFHFAVYYDGTGDTYQRIIDKSTSGTGTNGYAVYAWSGTSSPADGPLKVDQNGNQRCVGINPTLNTWQLWTVTHDASTGNYVWYLNGVQVASGTETYLCPNVTANMTIGSWNHSTARELKGKISFMRVYSRALNLAEVEAAHNFYANRFNLAEV